MCGFIAQLVEHRTGIAEVTGSNPVEALLFFRLLLSNCLSWKIYCDDLSSLSSTTAVQIWIISYILHIISGFYDENIEMLFSGQLRKLEESMAADEEEIEKLRGEEKEKLKVFISNPLLVLILYSVLKDTGSCLIWFCYQLCQGYLRVVVWSNFSPLIF